MARRNLQLNFITLYAAKSWGNTSNTRLRAATVT